MEKYKKIIGSLLFAVITLAMLYGTANLLRDRETTLADLYDELLMPPELRKAHQANDRAVMEAYGFPIKTITEADCVAELMKMYQDLTKKLRLSNSGKCKK